MRTVGEVVGQGAKIGQWRFEDGRMEGPDAPPDSGMPTPEDIAAAGTPPRCLSFSSLLLFRQ